jgi:hypothetical protein
MLRWFQPHGLAESETRVKLPIQKIRPEQIPTPHVGIGQERPIGRAVVIWPGLEATLHDLIWTIQGKGLAEGREETEKHLIGRLLKELRKIGSRSSTETVSTEIHLAVLAVAGAVQALSEDRNLIVHGTWCELDGVPSVGSLQLETIDRNDVTFESFPPDRLRDFIRDVTACRDQAMAIIAQVESSGRGPAGKGAWTPKGVQRSA